jgi:glycosyltransferase involved in cell wall biosynthesis
MVGPFGFHPNKTMRSRALPLARALVQRGHTLSLFLPPWQTPAEAGKHWQEDGIAIRTVPLKGGVPGITRRLVQETLAWQPDVVHTFKPKAYSGLVAWWLWRFHRHHLRLVTDTDDWEGWGGWNNRAPYTPLQKRFFAWQEQWGLRHNHALTVASRALQTLAWATGRPPHHIHYLPNGPGIRLESPSPSEGEGLGERVKLGLANRPTLLLYTRLFEFDPGRLIAILTHVKAALPNLAVLLVGLSLFEQDAAALRQQADAAALSDTFIEAGWVEEPKLPALLASADVALYLMDDTLLNRTKCPVKLADLLAVGLPVVAEAVGQVPEYIRHQQTGLRRPTGDVDGLAADLISLLQNPAERQHFSAAAQTHLQQNFSWQHLATIAERAYNPQP